MTPISRRRFLHGATAAGAAVALGACSDGGTTPAGRPAVPTSAPVAPSGGEPVLVLVTLYGGNDALNTVAPVLDDRYIAARGALALDPAATHDVGDGFALHPALAGCKQLWDQGRFAAVHGVGFDGLDRSHFHCMDVWQAGDLDRPTTGWLGRWLDAAGRDALDAVVVGRGLPLLARGEQRAAAVVPPGPFDLPGDDTLAALLPGATATDDADSPLEAKVAASAGDLLGVAGAVAPFLDGSVAGEALADRLGVVATLLEAGIPARAFATDLGGFDTHSQQAATHAALLAELDAGLVAFLDRVAGLDRPVTVAITSEFGRRVVPNASAGTDHGAAGTVLLAGAVRGGHHGEPPPLDALVDGDLATTVDFRAVLGGLLEDVLAIDAADVIEEAPRPLRLV